MLPLGSLRRCHPANYYLHICYWVFTEIYSPYQQSQFKDRYPFPWIKTSVFSEVCVSSSGSSTSSSWRELCEKITTNRQDCFLPFLPFCIEERWSKPHDFFSHFIYLVSSSPEINPIPRTFCEPLISSVLFGPMHSKLKRRPGQMNFC